ncbi:MAG: PSD1 and planctomycete cytochrome C domain-containing protein [Planctomycetota bacterium]|nr:PSD1 and planctomycete cytochrome C domain-containing protein [Planctomycetota bacterium]
MSQFTCESFQQLCAAVVCMREQKTSIINSKALRVLLLVLGTGYAALAHLPTAYSDDIEFNRDIRPILSENCFVCHGPDQNKLEGGLRLDFRDQAVAEADSGKAAIVAGHPEQSELMVRVQSNDPDIVMPPPLVDKKLTKAQKEMLEKWIANGATYQGHWAFIPPVHPSLPVDANRENESSNLIDHFVRARLAKENIRPSPEADRATLIRRATLDLTGLPPTPGDIDSFLEDSSPSAYEKVVDRLLASPHYGERMALTWMDYARYADSNGFQSDGSRDIWAWRDWLIQAYNRNLPFDQFTIEQLAGDMLPNASRDQIIATGFNRNHRLNGEGGRIEEEWFVETVIDRVETTGLTWLGLTFNCCRCHDHKYDPISQKEFYSFFAYFNSNEEKGVLAPAGKEGENTPPLLKLTSPEQEAEIAKLEAAIRDSEKVLASTKKELPAAMAAWEKSLIDGELELVTDWRQLDAESAISEAGAVLTKQSDGSYLASGENPKIETYVVKGKSERDELTAVMLEVFPDPSLPNESLGRASNGNFVLSEVLVEIVDTNQTKPTKIKLVKAMADYEQNGWPAKSILTPEANRNSGGDIGWSIDGNDKNKRIPRRLILVADKVAKIPKHATIQITLKSASKFAQHNVGRFRLSTTDRPLSEISLQSSLSPAEILKIVSIEVAKRTEKQKKLVEDFYHKQVASPYRSASEKLESAKKKLADYQLKVPTTMVMKESRLKEAFVLTRGEYDKPTEKVTRAIPAVFVSNADSQPADRLELARWIVSPKNPLTARVWVNREWERFFGVGLVKTTENFGAQADYPSHPELLDWLACEFMEPSLNKSNSDQQTNRWDMKALQKLIVMSQTYRQSQRVDPETLQRDPENRLLARATRMRLSGEILRDVSLSVSGLLVDKIGGPSVRPYMPAGVWDETSKYGNLRNYKNDKGEGLYRRSMYTIWKRTAAPPTMLLFDAPNRETCTIKRSRTNTPLQALSLLNEVTFVEAARQLGARMIREGGDIDQDRIRYGFRLAVGRLPSEREQEVLLKGLAEDVQRFEKDPETAKQLLKLGESQSASDLDSKTHAAFTLVANVLMNLDEFVTRE